MGKLARDVSRVYVSLPRRVPPGLAACRETQVDAPALLPEFHGAFNFPWSLAPEDHGSNRGERGRQTLGLNTPFNPVDYTERGHVSDDALARGLSSLDALETSVEPLHLQTGAQLALHRKFADERYRVVSAFWKSGDPGLTKRAAKMEDCCRWPMLAKDSKNRPIALLGYCRDRMCPKCQERRSHRVFAASMAAIAKASSIRFVTLTLAQSERSLDDQLDHLTNSFRRLRQSELWKQSVDGGIATIEVTRGQRCGHWHVHMHVLITGKYISQGALSEQWKRASEGSFIVDIRAVHDRAKATRYVAKYASKPANTKSWEEADLVEFAKGVKGKRMIIAFGIYHSSKIERDNEPERAKLDCSVVTFGLLKSQSEAGNKNAIRASEILQKMGPSFASCLGITSAASARSETQAINEVELSELWSCCEQVVRELAESVKISSQESLPSLKSKKIQLEFEFESRLLGRKL